MNHVLAALTLAAGLAAYSCKSAQGDFRAGVSIPPGFYFGADGSWGGDAGDPGLCGCLTFFDENGEPLEPRGEIRAGVGAGHAPPGASGPWSFVARSCEDFTDCADQDDDDPSPDDDPGSGDDDHARGAGGRMDDPGHDPGSGRLAGAGLHVPRQAWPSWTLIGNGEGTRRMRTYHMTVVAPSLAAANRKRDLVLDRWRDVPVPDDVDLHYLAEFEYETLTAWVVNDEHIVELELRVNGEREFAGPSTVRSDAGYHFIPYKVSLLDLEWEQNTFEFVMTTASDGVQELTATVVRQ